MAGDDVTLILPPRADQSAMLDFGLVALTEAISQIAPDTLGGGLLGGEFGYGANYENDVFAMRTYYWGDCDCGYEQKESEWSASHEHSPECYLSRVASDLLTAGGITSTFSATYIDRPHGISYERWGKLQDGIRRKWCKHFGLSFPEGSAVHCTCEYEKAWRVWSSQNRHHATCSLELPNFLHKASGLEVRWYKWIGRSMETKGAADIRKVFEESLASLKKV